MRIFWRFTNSDNGTITASNTASGYAAGNLQLNTLGKRWASDEVTATATLLQNFGSAKPVDSFALLGHNLVPGSDTVTLKLASDSGITTDVVTVAHNLTADDWFEYFPQVSRQYLQVVITKSLSTNQVHAGRLVAGLHYQMTYGLRPNYSIGPGVTLTKTVRTRGGQKYSNPGETLKVLRGKFTALSDADYAEIQALQKTNSAGTPFIVSMDWGEYPVEKSIYGTLDRIVPFTNNAIDKWDWPLAMTEQK